MVVYCTHHFTGFTRRTSSAVNTSLTRFSHRSGRTSFASITLETDWAGHTNSAGGTASARGSHGADGSISTLSTSGTNRTLRTGETSETTGARGASRATGTNGTAFTLQGRR